MFQPKTFQELIDNEANLPELISENGRLNRFLATQQEYDTFIASYSRQEHVERIRSEMNGLSVAILPNNFAYDMLLAGFPNVKHYCLWVDNESIKNKFNNPSKKDVEDYIRMCFGGRKFVIFKNLVKNQSIPELEHYHIFVEFN